MRKIINVLSLVIIVGTIIQIGYLYYQREGSASLAPSQSPSFRQFPLGQTRFIDFETDQETLAHLTLREQRDQQLDWLLFTIASDAGLSLEALNQVFYDLPPVRHGYVQPVANFEYGDTRSAYIGEGQVVALLPTGAQGAERQDRLAHIADEHRKNVGEIPKTLWVFEYELDAAENFGLLTRRTPVIAQTLFTPEAGYTERTLKTLADLRAFMAQIDDLTFARREGSYLTVGGRKIMARAYRPITVEDVAAIWQAEQKIQEELEVFYARWDKKYQEFQQREKLGLANLLPTPNPNFFATPNPLLERLLKESAFGEPRTLEEFQQQMFAEQQELGLVNGSGFSLDPAYDYEGLSQLFAELKPDLEVIASGRALSESEYVCQTLYFTFLFNRPESELEDKLASALTQASGAEIDSYCTLLTPLLTEAGLAPELILANPAPPITEADIRLAEEGLANHEIEPYFLLLDRLDKSTHPALPILGSAIFDLGGEYQFQHARYDGNLQGTEVGMVLFYTDLLAKLWALDYQGNMPDKYIEEFDPMTEVSLSPIYAKELEELSHTRLWFGPQNKGFQVAEAGYSLLLGRTATRIYAASASQYTPGVEAEPNAQSAAFLGWWNNHYEEVARYEPEYERLNEIMKWSLLISWLNEAERGDLLAFLEPVPVERDNWFPDWVRRQRDLKYQAWDKVGFYSEGYKGVTTESLPRLSSEEYTLFGRSEGHYLSGGVSLAAKDIFKGRGTLAASLNKLMRRSNLKYDISGLGDNLLQTLDNVTYNFQRLTPRRVSVTASAGEASKFRGSYGELANLSFERTLFQDSLGLDLQLKAGNASLGQLKIGKTPNGFKVGWSGLDIEAGQSLARRLSASPDPRAALLDDLKTQIIIETEQPGQYLVKLVDSESWLKVAPEEIPSANLAEGWQARVADHGGNATNFQLAWLDDDKLLEELAKVEYISLEPVEGSHKTLIRYTDVRGPPPGSQPVDLQFETGPFKAHLNPETGALYTRWGDLPEPLQRQPDMMFKLLKSSEPPSLAGDTFLQKLNSKAYDELAQDIATSPEAARAKLDQNLAEKLRLSDQLLAEGQFDRVIRELDIQIEIYGPKPELTLRKALAQVGQRHPRKSALALNETEFETWSKESRTLFFDEINQRLSQPELTPVEQNNLRRLAEFADWQELQAQNAVPEGQIVAAAEGEELTLQYHMATAPAGEAVPAGQALPEEATLYVEESLLGLPNLDWSVSTEHSLQQLIAGDLGRVIRLPQDNLAHFNPTMIYTPEGQQLRRVTKVRTSPSVSRYIPYRESCPEGEEACQEEQRPVYLALPDK